MIRTIVAVFPPPEVREALFQAARNLPTSGDFRLVGKEKIHLTLMFLGDVAEDDYIEAWVEVWLTFADAMSPQQTTVEEGVAHGTH